MKGAVTRECISTFLDRALYCRTYNKCRGAVVMRITVAMAVACLIGGLAVADNAKAAAKRNTSIPAQDLKTALQTLATDRDFQILYRTEVVGDRHTTGA